MGMILSVTAVSDEKIDRMLADPPLIWKLLAPDDPEIYAETVSPTPEPGLLSRLFPRLFPAPAPPSPPLRGFHADGGFIRHGTIPRLLYASSVKRNVTTSKNRSGTPHFQPGLLMGGR